MIEINGVEMIDVRAAAALVGRTPETVRRWVWTHRINAVKHGNKLMMSRDAVIRLGHCESPAELGGNELTLRDWAAKVRTTNTAGRSGESARDLVLDDRAERRAESASAGR